MRGRARAALGRLLRPGGGWMLALGVLGTAGLVVTFGTGREETAFGVASYVVAAYALAVLVAGVPPVVRRVRAAVDGHEYGGRLLHDLPFRALVSLHVSLVVNLAFAAFKLVTGVLYASQWFVAVGVYYAVMAVMRALLLFSLHGGAPDLRAEVRRVRVCGGLLFLLTAALSGMMVPMIVRGQGNRYPGVFVYAFAAYAFYSLTLSIVGLVRYRRLKRPVLSAAKMLHFATALVAMLSLQVALLSEFGEGHALEALLNSVSGAAVCLTILGMGIGVVVRANRALRQLPRER